MPTSFYFTFLFAFGLAFGSFFNVLITRYDPDLNVFAEKSIGGRSHCMHCRRALLWFELIPLVSFIVLNGKCRTCRAKLSYQYPVGELVTGAIFAGTPLFLNAFYGVANAAFFALTLPAWYYALIAVWVLAISVFFLITAIDLKWFLIPNELTLTLVVLGLVVSCLSRSIVASPLVLPYHLSFLTHYTLIVPMFQNPLWDHLVGAVVGLSFFWALSILTRGRGIGFGDVKLAFALGLLFGWPDIALIAMLAFILGGLWSVGLVIMGMKKMKDRVPFAPFFVMGALLVLFFGTAILKGYFAVFGL